MRGNPGNLRRAAAAKSAAAKARADRGLSELCLRGDPITFRGLAQAAGVSLDFLYRTPKIRRRAEQLRAQQEATTPPPSLPASPAACSAPSPPSSPSSNAVTVTK